MLFKGFSNWLDFSHSVEELKRKDENHANYFMLISRAVTTALGGICTGRL